MGFFPLLVWRQYWSNSLCGCLAPHVNTCLPYTGTHICHSFPEWLNDFHVTNMLQLLAFFRLKHSENHQLSSCLPATDFPSPDTFPPLSFFFFLKKKVRKQVKKKNIGTLLPTKPRVSIPGGSAGTRLILYFGGRLPMGTILVCP